ncbi:MAG TPA: glycosyltransferase family 4 protein [Verrucomicrobiae bacterium]|jgi:glycosyltransferase involved in cell wall biosynthesis|nr:glycosyltransferase family 4 protein [Verrucomicrobiae bacterium]
MRITHVITRLIIGGAQENTLSSVLGLRQKPGLEVKLVSGPSAGPEGSLESFDPQLLVLPNLVRPIHPYRDFLALRELEQLFRETKPDLVHTHSGKAGILGRLAAARADVPLIVHTIHGPSFGNFQGAAANFVFRAAERRAGCVTTHFVTVAEAMTEQYLAAGIGSREQYTKIFSGFNLAPFLSAQNDPTLRAKLGLAPEDIVIGKIARLFKLKGHEDLFTIAPELVRRNPRIKFLLVGDGSWRKKFEDRARALGLEKRVVFAGLVPPDAVPRFVGVMDALVHLSLREGLPRALPQALAAGKPVVSYDCDGAREVCVDEKTGFLLRPGDLNGLTDKLTRLAGDASLRERLGQTGREFVRDNFSVERMVDSLHALYLKLATASPNRQHG